MRERPKARLTRRTVLHGALSLGVSVLIGRAAQALAESVALPLIRKTIPSSGEPLPAIGLGTDSFRDAVREEIRAELQRLPELGGTVIDTAAAYGDSEALIGSALESLGTRAKMFLATKLVARDRKSVV